MVKVVVKSQRRCRHMVRLSTHSLCPLPSDIHIRNSLNGYYLRVLFPEPVSRRARGYARFDHPNLHPRSTLRDEYRPVLEARTIQ
jgi:hypothetical protein